VLGHLLEVCESEKYWNAVDRIVGVENIGVDEIVGAELGDRKGLEMSFSAILCFMIEGSI
jgi:hypothetical protein